jgi:hypothetical protein
LASCVLLLLMVAECIGRGKALCGCVWEVLLLWDAFARDADLVVCESIATPL